MPITETEDVSAQRAALADAREDLARALDALAADATAAAKRARSRARTRADRVDLTEVHTAHRTVARAEEQVDMAALDVHTAAGGDA